MKKSASIFLIFIYTLSVVGLAINKFYCCGKLESVSFVENPKHIQAEKESKAKGCCKNEKTAFKIKDSHVSAKKTTLDVKFFELTPAPVTSVFTLKSPPVTEYISYFIKGPPKYPATPVYILNCTYRI